MKSKYLRYIVSVSLGVLSLNALSANDINIQTTEKGTTSFIKGDLGKINAAPSSMAIKQLLTSNSHYALNGNEDFSVKEQWLDKLGKQHLRLNQTINGLPVYGTSLIVHSTVKLTGLQSAVSENDVYAITGVVASANKTSLKNKIATSVKSDANKIKKIFDICFDPINTEDPYSQIEKEKAIQIEREKGLRAVIGSQEEERERIAKNLHDGVIQQLVSLKFGMDSLLDDHKTKLVKQLDDATYELRDLSHELMPKNLEKFGLNEAISNLFETSLVNTNINYTYDCYGLKNNISKDIEINLYRTVQELIHNAVKHSNANQIDAQLYQIENSLHLIFEDNGKGFDIEEKAQGIGLQSINSRIKTINGTVNYESKPNEGAITTVKIQIN